MMNIVIMVLMHYMLPAYVALLMFFAPLPKETHLARGDEYYLALDNKQALTEYELAYKESPTDYTSLLRMVRIYNDNGRIHLRQDTVSESEYRTALMYADSLVYYYPDSAAAQFWVALAKGSLLPFVGVWKKISIGKEVKQHVQKSLERDSTFSYPYVIRAIFERVGSQLSWIEKGIVRVVFGTNLSGTLEESEKNLKLALRYDTTNSFAYYELFRTYHEMGDTAQAASSLRHILEMQPKSLREKYQQDDAKRHLLKLSK
jgi:tetratricopeptide (TPR) repeat protein